MRIDKNSGQKRLQRHLESAFPFMHEDVIVESEVRVA